ncbi:MAG: phosphoglycolate phosphatase [Ignavibacteria bacterium]|nr:phosphoglycolate phosphatase [Ignavibacteria bacterium]
MKPKQKLILFDIDGTILLLNSGIARSLFVRAIDEILHVPCTLSGNVSFAGKTDLSILFDFLQAEGIDQTIDNTQINRLWERLTELFGNYCTSEYIRLLPGVKELIGTFQNDEHTTLGLLTGNFKSNAYLKLSAFNLHTYFPFGAFGCERINRSELPPLAIERANQFKAPVYFNHRNTIIIGDSPLDIKCAKDNYLPVLCVATGGFSYNQLAELTPDLIFENLEDTDTIINSINELLL